MKQLLTWDYTCIVMWCTSRENRPQCLRTKRRMGAHDVIWYDIDFSEFDSADAVHYILEKWPHPSSFCMFWYDNYKDLKVCFLVTHIMCFEDPILFYWTLILSDYNSFLNIFPHSQWNLLKCCLNITYKIPCLFLPNRLWKLRSMCYKSKSK